MFLSLYDEYVVRSEFVNIAEITLNEVKFIILLLIFNIDVIL